MLRTLVNVDPMNEIKSMEDLFDRFLGHSHQPVQSSGTLPIDITERDGALYVKAAVPGVEPSNLQITVEGNVLSIRGETKNQIEHEKEKIYRREVSYGAFSRSIRLPEKVEVESIEANFDHGMVTIRIPRTPEVRPKVLNIPVTNANTTPNQE